jgi:hypothetical protein
MVRPIDFYNLSQVVGRDLGIEDDWSTELSGEQNLVRDET